MPEPVAAGPALFQLPREIRDLIYSCLLDACNEAPPNPSYPGDRIKMKGHGSRNRPRSLVPTSYPANAYQCDYIGLLRTNQQFRAEILDLTGKRLASGRTTAKLDLMVKGYVAYPTWTYFPWFAHPGWKASACEHTNFDVDENRSLNVDVSLRIFSTEGFRRNDGWPRQPGSSFRDLFLLLQQFIEFGSGFGQSCDRSQTISSLDLPRMESEWLTNDRLLETAERRLFRIDTLSVDIEFYDMYTRATHPETVHMIFKALKELALSGFFRHRIRCIKARCRYTRHGTDVEWTNEWAVSTRPDVNVLQEWDNLGFINFGEEEYRLYGNVE
jgi:hypothetical protein